MSIEDKKLSNERRYYTCPECGAVLRIPPGTLPNYARQCERHNVKR